MKQLYKALWHGRFVFVLLGVQTLINFTGLDFTKRSNQVRETTQASIEMMSTINLIDRRVFVLFSIRELEDLTLSPSTLKVGKNGVEVGCMFKISTPRWWNGSAFKHSILPLPDATVGSLQCHKSLVYPLFMMEKDDC